MEWFIQYICFLPNFAIICIIQSFNYNPFPIPQMAICNIIQLHNIPMYFEIMQQYLFWYNSQQMQSTGKLSITQISTIENLYNQY